MPSAARSGPAVRAWAGGREAPEPFRPPSHSARLRSPPNPCSLPAPSPQPFSLESSWGAFPSSPSLAAVIGHVLLTWQTLPPYPSPHSPFPPPSSMSRALSHPCAGERGHSGGCTRSLPQGKLALMPREDCSTEENQVFFVTCPPLPYPFWPCFRGDPQKNLLNSLLPLCSWSNLHSLTTCNRF